MIRIGVDPGFGNFKVATVRGIEVEVSVVPSVVGVGETDLGLLSIGTLGRRRNCSPSARWAVAASGPSPTVWPSAV